MIDRIKWSCYDANKRKNGIDRMGGGPHVTENKPQCALDFTACCVDPVCPGAGNALWRFDSVPAVHICAF